MKRICFVYISVFICFAGFTQQKEFLITGFGAKSGGMVNTLEIQAAIDAAAAAGGGTVIIPAGRFVSGTIELKSNVTLKLEKGAILEGSNQRKDYEGSSHPALILAMKQKNISVTGSGTIDGKGRELMKDIFRRLEEGTLTDPDWKTKRPAEATRTNLLYFEECSHVNVNGVTFKDATSWVTHYERCSNLTIDRIRVESVAYWNNDGIDIVDCRNVRITNSFINSADDAICLKSSRRNEFCDSIYIANCILRSSANAFKLGTGSLGGFRNITVRNLSIYDTYRSAIALEAVDGGFLENIDIKNVKATHTGNAIFIRLGHRNKDDVSSIVRNIRIANVKVEVPAGKPDAGYEMEGPLLKYPPGIKPEAEKFVNISPWNHSSKDPEAILYRHNVFPSSISGLPGHPVENISLENIEITYEGGADKTINYFPLDSFQLITEAEKDYPEFSMFGELPAWGFYLRHVKGLTLKNIRLVKKKEDYRTAILLNDGEDVSLERIEIKGPVTNPAVFINAVKSLSIQKVDVPDAGENAVRIIASEKNSK